MKASQDSSAYTDTSGEQVADLQVYVAEGNGEEWKLDGIVWQSKAT